jgi:hypothetical protein
MKQHQLLRETCSRADRATHTPFPGNFRSALSSGNKPDAVARGTRQQTAPADPKPHLWLGVTWRDLQDMALLAAIAFACVGLMVLGTL